METFPAGKAMQLLQNRRICLRVQVASTPSEGKPSSTSHGNAKNDTNPKSEKKSAKSDSSFEAVKLFCMIYIYMCVRAACVFLCMCYCYIISTLPNFTRARVLHRRRHTFDALPLHSPRRIRPLRTNRHPPFVLTLCTLAFPAPTSPFQKQNVAAFAALSPTPSRITWRSISKRPRRAKRPRHRSRFQPSPLLRRSRARATLRLNSLPAIRRQRRIWTWSTCSFVHSVRRNSDSDTTTFSSSNCHHHFPLIQTHESLDDCFDVPFEERLDASETSFREDLRRNFFVDNNASSSSGRRQKASSVARSSNSPDDVSNRSHAFRMSRGNCALTCGRDFTNAAQEEEENFFFFFFCSFFCATTTTTLLLLLLLVVVVGKERGARCWSRCRHIYTRDDDDDERAPGFSLFKRSLSEH